MRTGALVGMIIGGSAAAQAFAAPITDAQMARQLRGCWTQTGWGPQIEAERLDPNFTIASTICLAGGVTGQIEATDCDGRPMVECRSSHYGYALHDEKFWRQFGDANPQLNTVSCDVRLSADAELLLHGCTSHAPDGGVIGTIDDASFRKGARP